MTKFTANQAVTVNGVAHTVRSAGPGWVHVKNNETRFSRSVKDTEVVAA